MNELQMQNAPRMVELWGSKFQTLGFKPGPDGGARVGDADGIYYFFGALGPDDARDIQLVVLGAMKHTPLELARMIGKVDGAPTSYWVKGVAPLPPGDKLPDAMKCIVYERGFWAIHLRSRAFEARPGFE